MPIYDYRCNDCSTVYDVFHKGSEIVDDIICPSCGSRNFKKLISAPMISTGNSINSSGGYSSSSCSSCSSSSCSTCGSK